MLPVREPVPVTLTAPQTECSFCGSELAICQHRERTIRRKDQTLQVTCRDKGCANQACSMRHLRYRPVEEPFLALSGQIIGLDVCLEIGRLRFREQFSFLRIFHKLIEQGIPIGQRTVQDHFQCYLSLMASQVARSDGPLMERLRKQGAILPMVDGVQFGSGEPVLYLLFDALSGQLLFAEQKVCRAAEDLAPFIAQLNQLNLPIIAVVSDKEKGLVPAIQTALPGVPHQYCQLHYIANAAKPMEKDLKALGEQVRETETKLRDFQRKLIRERDKLEHDAKPVPPELPVTLELCECARAEATRYTRAPFAPPALKRHEGLERVTQAVREARRKKGGLGESSRNSKVS